MKLAPYFVLWLVGIALLSSCDPAPSHPMVKVQIDLRQHKANKIIVHYYPHTPLPDSSVFSFTHSDGIYHFGDQIENLRVEDVYGNMIRYYRTDDQDFMIPQASMLKAIHYEVYDRWFTEDQGYLPAAAHIRNDAAFFSHIEILGHFDECRSLTHEIEYIDSELSIESTFVKEQAKSKTDSSYILRFPDYNTALTQSILYSPHKSITFQSAQSHIVLSVRHPHFGVQEAQALKELIKPLLDTAFSHYVQGIDSVYINLLYYHELSEQGLGFPNTINLLIPWHYDSKTRNEILLDLMAHELLHLVTPVQIRDNISENNIFYKKQMSQHNWFTEGFTEYNSRSLLLDAGYYDSLDFVNKLGKYLYQHEKYYQGKLDSIPITWYSENIADTNLHIPNYIFYQEGVLYAFCMDAILERSGSGLRLKNLMDTLQSIYANKKYSNQSLIDDLIRYGHDDFRSFISHHIYDTVAIDFAQYLEVFGMKQTRRVDYSTHPYIASFDLNTGVRFTKKGLYLLHQKDTVYVHNINGHGIDPGYIYEHLSPRDSSQIILNKGLEQERILIADTQAYYRTRRVLHFQSKQSFPDKSQRYY